MKSPPQDSYDLIMVIAHMGPGGAQRVASLLLNYWARQGKRLCLVTLHEHPPDAHLLESNIDRICIGLKNSELRISKANWQIRNRLLLWLKALGLNESPLLLWLKALGLNKSPFTAIRQKLSRLIYELHKRVWVLLVSDSSPGKKRTLRRSLLIIGKKLLSDEMVIRLCRFGFTLVHRDLSRRIRRLRFLFREMSAPVVLSFLGATNLQTIIAGVGIVPKLVISERNDPTMQQLAFPWEHLRKRLYKTADVITANSLGAVESMTAFVPSEKLIYLPNPIILPASCGKAEERQCVILFVGRLVEQKGVDLLIEAFSTIWGQIPGWRLEIVGDGRAKSVLEDLAYVRGVSSKVNFRGYQKKVLEHYYQASIFVLPSRYEGTPNSLIEAMWCGLPVIVSDASPGPLELVSHGTNGLVFPSENVRSLAEALLTLARDEQARTKMGLASRQEANRFRMCSVADIWDKVLYGS